MAAAVPTAYHPPGERWVAALLRARRKGCARRSRRRHHHGEGENRGREVEIKTRLGGDEGHLGPTE